MRQQAEAGGGYKRAGRTAVSPRTSARFATELSTQCSEYKQFALRRSGRSRLSGGVGCERISSQGVDRVGKPYGAAGQLVGGANAEGAAAENQCGRFASLVCSAQLCYDTLGMKVEGTHNMFWLAKCTGWSLDSAGDVRGYVWQSCVGVSGFGQQQNMRVAVAVD